MNLKNQLIFLVILILSITTNIFAGPDILPKDIDQMLMQVYQKYKNTKLGKNADYIPELAKIDPALFGIVIVDIHGEMKSIGDVDVPFAIESISKPFVYALALHDQGEKIVTDKIGLNATGHRFNSVIAIEEKLDHRQNPLVNAGAIQVTSMIKGNNSPDKWQRVLNFIKALSDGKPYFGETVYQSEMATNQHNRAIAELLGSYHMMASSPIDAVDRYTKACSIMVTAKQLALMGAVLANKGMHPMTHQYILSPKEVQNTLSQMVINGLYENSGTWFWTVGLPAKSGVGGGILAIVPNKMAIVVFSPPLDDSGNSVRGQQVIQELSQQWKLHLLS